MGLIVNPTGKNMMVGPDYADVSVEDPFCFLYSESRESIVNHPIADRRVVAVSFALFDDASACSDPP